MKLNQMLLVGATQKHIGKTAFSTRVIKSVTRAGIPLVAAKITVIRDGKKTKNGWILDEEKGEHPHKDTGRMLAAGASKVFWLRCEEQFMQQGMDELLKEVEDLPLVAESNSIRHIVTPSLFIMIRPTVESELKPTAQAVLSFPHQEIRVEMHGDDILYQPDIADQVHFIDGIWKVK
ncbi:hypothetical protein KAH37_01050 [bacterium]|nr:hypothetical protein [bacterium]